MISCINVKIRWRTFIKRQTERELTETEKDIWGGGGQNQESGILIKSDWNTGEYGEQNPVTAA